MTGKQLVKYINRLKINLPDPKIDSKQVYETLTSTMSFDENVTDEDIDKLIDILSKTTNYFIASALHHQNPVKKTLN